MSTRSYIGKLNKDNTITAIYCHFDGYPSSVGALLYVFYNTEEKLNELLGLGDLRSLESDLETTEAFEENLGGDTYSMDEYLNENSYADYLYLFKNNEWFVKSDSTTSFVPLENYVK
jgi:hypothetical protein